MVKYNIVNKETNQIICKPKSGLARHYRRHISDNSDPALIPVCTTIGRAQREADFLNAEYYPGWIIEQVKMEGVDE